MKQSSGKRLFLMCLLLFVAALCRYWVTDFSEPVPHDPESFRLARSIAFKGEFSDPFIPLDTGASAHLAPAFPAFLALLIRLFGDGTTGMYAIKLAAAVALSAAIALFPVASQALGMGFANGVIAACVWIAAKIGTAGSHGHQEVAMFGWEALYAALLVGIAVCLFRAYLDSGGNDATRLAWCLGCVAGVLTLIAFTASVIFTGFAALLIWKEKLGIFSKRGLLLVALLPVVIVAPWTVRNALVFKRFIPVRDNAGLELSVSNNDCAMFGLYQNFDCFLKVHPNGNIDEARKVLALGEPGYNDQKLHEALTWISKNPVKFAKLCAFRIAAFWVPPSNEGRSYSVLGIGHRTERLVIYLMTLLSSGGLVILYRRDRLSASLCLICLVLYPLIYYVVQYEYRYRYPILWVTFLLGSLPVTVFVQRIYGWLSNRLRIENISRPEESLL